MAIASMASWCTPIVLFCVSNLIIATLFISSKSSNPKTTKNLDHVNNSNAYSFRFTPKIPRVSSFLERAKSIDISKIIPNIVITAISLPVKPFQPKTAKYTSMSRLSQSIFSTCSYDNQPDCKRYPSNKPNPTPLLGRLKSIDFSTIYDTNKMTTELDDISNSPSQLGEHRVNPTATESSRPMQCQLVQVSTPTKYEKTRVMKTVSEVKKSRSKVRDASDDEDDLDLRRTESARAKMNADDDAKADKFINKFRAQLKLQRLDSLGRYNDMLRRPS